MNWNTSAKRRVNKRKSVELLGIDNKKRKNQVIGSYINNNYQKLSTNILKPNNYNGISRDGILSHIFVT